MNLRWEYFLIPSFVVSFVLTFASQYIFLERSFYVDLRLGRMGDEFTLANYLRFFSDPFYLDVLWVTVKVSALATVFTLAMAYPVAYAISRIRSSLAMLMLAGVVVSTFVTIVIKVYGLIIIFASNGLLNRGLMALGVTSEPYTVFGSEEGVVVGLMHFTIGFGVLVLYSVIQTIPRSYEEAAQVHGASRLRVYWRVIVPLTLPGVLVAGLTIFNMCMGAFTSAALLGGGRVFTLPVLIQRTVMMDVKYAMGATLAAVLFVAVLLINLLSIVAMRRSRIGRRVIA